MGEEIFGYKCFDKYLHAMNGFQYEIGKTYEIEETPIVGRIGFHFYDTLKEAFLNNFYPDNPKFCKVKILGDIDKEDAARCTNKIEILEEIIINEELKKSILDELIDDARWYARGFVAKQGYGLEKLIDDKDSLVRMAVVEQGYGLEKLIDDEDSHVRKEVAKQRFGLEKLINDKDGFVRSEVVRQRYKLDKLVDDEDWYVRAAVAEQGFGLEKLIDDKDSRVRKEVLNYIIDHYPDLAQDIQQLVKNYFNKAEE